MKERSAIQPSIPKQTGAIVPLSWDMMNPAQRSVICKATEVKRGKAFKSRSRRKIIFGKWADLGKAPQEELYASDWRKILKRAGMLA
jgi:hypothetical protein